MGDKTQTKHETHAEMAKMISQTLCVIENLFFIKPDRFFLALTIYITILCFIAAKRLFSVGE